jgi:hypothetical protein
MILFLSSHSLRFKPFYRPRHFEGNIVSTIWLKKQFLFFTIYLFEHFDISRLMILKRSLKITQTKKALKRTQLAVWWILILICYIYFFIKHSLVAFNKLFIFFNVLWNIFPKRRNDYHIDKREAPWSESPYKKIQQKTKFKTDETHNLKLLSLRFRTKGWSNLSIFSPP